MSVPDDLRQVFAEAQARREAAQGRREERRSGPTRSGRPFPTDVYPPVVRQFIERATDDVGCSSEFFGAGVLAVMGSAIGGETTVYLGGTWEERPTVWVAQVGPVGSGKTPANKVLIMPLRKIGAELAQGNRLALDAWEEADPKTRGAKPVERRAIVVDATMEALCDLLEANPKMLLHGDELTGWVRGFDQYRGGGRDRQHWLSIWTSDGISVSRKSKRLTSDIPHPFIAVLGGVQPPLLAELTKGDDGLFPRLLYAHGEANASRLPKPGRAPNYGEWERIVWALWSAPAATVELAASDRDAIENIHVALDRRKLTAEGEMAGFWSKAGGYLFRLALILNRMDAVTGEPAGPITSGQAERAGRLVEWFASTAEDALTMIEGHKADARRQQGEGDAVRRKAVAGFEQRVLRCRGRILAMLEERGPIVHSELRRMFRGPDRSAVDQGLEELLEAGLIDETAAHQGGRAYLLPAAD